MNTLLILQALWSVHCAALTCTFDATQSTGVIRSYSWTFGDSTPNSSGKIVGHTFTKAGTYKVLLKVYDGAKYSQLTKSITVSAVVVARVDTVIRYLPSPPIHDTVPVLSKPDTIRVYSTRTVYDTIQLPAVHDTIALTTRLPSTFPSMQASFGVKVDSVDAKTWRVWRYTYIGHVSKQDQTFTAWRLASAQTESETTLITTSVPWGKATSLDGALARILSVP
jgi:PKD repeat protein